MKRFALIVPLVIAIGLLSFEMVYFNFSEISGMPQMPIWLVLITDLTILCFGFNMLSYSAKMTRGGWLYRAIFFLLLAGAVLLRGLSLYALQFWALQAGVVFQVASLIWGSTIGDALFKRVVGSA